MATERLPQPCTCEWRDSRKGLYSTLWNRDPDCVRHGDGTTWWSGVTARAEELAAERRSR